jgi:hypothetical protein
MPIPDLPDFHEILSGIRLSPTKAPGQEASIQIPFMPAVDVSGPVSQEAPLWLHYPSGTTVTFERLVQRINKELSASRHATTAVLQGKAVHDRFAIFALALAALTPSHRGDIISRLNKILDSVCDADVTLYHILAVRFPEQYKFEIPPFTIGPLRGQKLGYNCEKAQSDFYSRYRDTLLNAWAIEREPRKARVLDIPQIREGIFGSPIDKIGRQNWELQAWESIVNDYFSLHNTALFDQFQAELVSAQSILLAAGAPFFDTRSLYMLSSVIQTHRVAVFLNLGTSKAGFVAPAGMGPLLIDVAGIHERVPNLLKELRKSYGFERFDESPLHRSIKLFANFVARGRRHEVDSHPNEALLHYVIALELIFGERQAIQKSVSERVALITFRENNRSFAQQRDWIDAVYDIRSRYVHDGVELTDQLQLDQLRGLCEQVFRCLMRLQAGHSQPASKGKEILTMWLHELDYLAKGMIAGKQPTETQFVEAFIAQ